MAWQAVAPERTVVRAAANARDSVRLIEIPERGAAKLRIHARPRKNFSRPLRKALCPDTFRESLEGWQNGYCTSLENWRAQALGGSSPSPSVALIDAFRARFSRPAVRHQEFFDVLESRE